MEKRTTPEEIRELGHGQIFVFGSNADGAHMGGAAGFAKMLFGAQDGIAQGMTGNCYAIDTMSGLDKIKEQIPAFVEYAKAAPKTVFLVTAIGTGIAGFKPEDIAPLFKDAVEVENIHLPASFWKILSAPVLKTFKGFDMDLKCRDFQYEIGKEYRHEGKVAACEEGFHACENPIDIFGYYPPSTSRYAETEQSGIIAKHGDDTKVASSYIKIGAEISLQNLILAGIKFVFERVTFTKEGSNTERSGAASNSGYSGAASNSGESGAASNSGNRGAASNSGESGAASNSGYRGAASNSGESGAASNSGDSGAASNSGNRGAASNSGNRGAASNSGYSGAASNSGNSGAASNSGYSGAASNSGNRGAASNSGYSGAASNSGYSGAASNSGYSGAASNSGNRGAASNSGESGAAYANGHYSSASTTGKDSIAVATGYQCKAKGELNTWLVLTERNDNLEILGIKSVKVDGKKIKADTWYQLKDGKLITC